MTNNNIVILKSAYNKTPGMKYKISPCPDKSGRMPDCVRKVDINGDMILSEKDKSDWTSGKKVFIKEDEPIVVEHGTVFDLDNPLQAAQWEAIKNSALIARDRSEKGVDGNYLIDGYDSVVDLHDNPKGRYGIAELYIEHPGKAAEARVSVAKLIHEAESLIFNDSLAHQVLICKLFDKDMTNSHPSDVEDYLLAQARKYPEKVKRFYNAEESSIRLLVISAKDKNIIRTVPDGMYYGDIKLGSNLDIVVDHVKEDKVLQKAIREETFPEYEPKKQTKKD